MDDFLQFLYTNLNTVNSDPQNKTYREGVYNSSLLDSLMCLDLDNVLMSRVFYIRNLCLKEPKNFQISNDIHPIEKAMMLVSMNHFEEALREMNSNFTCEVIGAKAITRTGATINIGVLQCYNAESTVMLDFTAKGNSFPEFKAQKLTHLELIIIFIKIKEIIKNEENETIKKFKLNAYLDRVLWKETELNDLMSRAFLTIDAEINNTVDELEKIKNTPEDVQITSEFFGNPITFKFDILIQLGLAYKEKLYFNEAYECLLPYPMFLEKIDCLISLRKAKEASMEIHQMINNIVDSTAREDKMILSNLYIKLAHLHSDPTCFDKSYDAFRSSKPLYLKGLFYFKTKQFELATDALCAALSLSPTCEKIRFSYACSLIEIDKLKLAIEILKELKSEDHSSENIAKNLSYCYYRLNDIESSLLSLKSVALSDPNSMSQFFILSVKNSLIDNVKWAFKNMCTIDLIKSGIAYYLTNKEIAVQELKELLSNNRYIDRAVFEEIFLINSNTN